MKTMAISEFRAHALRVLGEVEERRETVRITRRGKPIAQVVPYAEPVAVPGRLAAALVFEEDIVSPLGSDLWDAAR